VTIAAGISRLIPPAVHGDGRPSDIGAWVEGADLRVGWMVQLDDGRWCEVVGGPHLQLLGRVSVEVSWQGLPPEQVLIGFRRVMWARTPVQEAAYLDAVDRWAADAADTRGEG
jgi:hypothetical protein